MKLDPNSEYAKKVKNGYFASHKKKLSNNQLAKLPRKQVRKYYKAGLSGKDIFKRDIIFLVAGFCILISLVVFIFIFKYYTNLNYQKLAEEVDTKAKAYSWSTQFKECYSKYKYVYNPRSDPKEHYESISKGYWECKEQTNPTTATQPTPETGSESSSQSNTISGTNPSSGSQTNNYPDKSCIERTIPRITKYEYLPTQPQSYTYTQQGNDGLMETCAYKDGQVTQITKRTAVPDIVYQGTQVTQQPPPNNGLTLEQARQLCSQYGDSSAFYQCLRAYGY